MAGKTITFTEGVPQRISIADVLPAGADRYHGGYEACGSGYAPPYQYLPGVYFDPKTKEMVYDGSKMSLNPIAVTPNLGYYVGYESGPYGHWQFPPTMNPTPAPTAVNGKMTSMSIHGESKHTRFVYCPLDGKFYNMGGDYQALNLPTLRGGEDGRMVWWRVDVRTNPPTWDHYYPQWGKAGDQVPLQPDRMNWDWDPVHSVFWCAHGSDRMGPNGYYSNTLARFRKDFPNSTDFLQAWQYEAGTQTSVFADAVPEAISDPDCPILVFDPIAGTMKYACASPVLKAPWTAGNTTDNVMQSTTFHVASKRWYAVRKYNSGLRISWLDTTPFPSNPTALAWQEVDVDLSTSAANNLTGTGNHAYNAGIGGGSPVFCDQTKHIVYMIDSGPSPAVLGLTLPGHSLGAHKVILVADLSPILNYATGYAHNADWSPKNLPGPLPGFNAGYNSPSGVTLMSTSPHAWIPEHRALVVMMEPGSEQVGVWSRSMEINVDTGTVTEGPRFPNSELDGMPWFPNACLWHAPTDELILYGIYMFEPKINCNRSWDVTGGTVPSVWNRYHW